MDKDAITTLATQLGIARDDAAQYLHEILPQYAQMAIGRWVAVLIIGLLIIAIGLIVWRRCSRLDDKWRSREANGEITWSEYNSKDYKDIAGFALIVAGTAAVVLCIAIPFAVHDMASWVISPDARFFELVLNKLGS